MTIPEGVRFIDANAILSANNTSIGVKRLKYIEKIEFPSTLKGIESGWATPFLNLGQERITGTTLVSLKSIDLPDGLYYIGEGAFLTLFGYPKGSNSAFDGWDSGVDESGPKYKEVTIPASVGEIGNYALGYYASFDKEGDSIPNIHKIDGFKIKCYKDTAGEKYAKDNGFDYELLDGNSSKPEDKKFSKGDANGDNEINVTDIAVTAAHIKGIKALDENAVKTADVNADGEVNVTDIAMIAAHIKGIKAIG